MPAPADELLSEHALIRRMLVILERIGERTDWGERLPAADVGELVRFFREFVEGVHHAKEQEFCYPSAVLDGHEEIVEALGELTGEHEDSRGLLDGLMLFSEPDDLSRDERGDFAGLAAAYVRRMREHMQVEEESLYPTVRVRMVGNEQAILARFREIEVQHDSFEHWTRRCAVLEERWPGDATGC